ncbi:predicted membrane protein [Vibrio maritimus]|uniref:Predicted membrane protein n=1 Tax=Vibrio maritimus TaxID=990268 RepID=A0A090RWW7_9VIBR|nr:predicted membrane protein [Vibrio maritimus]
MYNLFVPLIVGYLVWDRSSWRGEVSDTIFFKDAMLNNNLTAVSSGSQYTVSALQERFTEFNRGNEGYGIKGLYQGSHQIYDDYSFDYKLYKYRYVIKRTETYTDSKGKLRTRTVRSEYFRDGLLFDFPYAKGVNVSADGRLKYKGERYTSASNEFNRSFKVTANEKIEAAKLLTPAVVETLNNGLEGS